MQKKLDVIKEKLFSANSDGSIICECINKIDQLITKGCDEGKWVLAEYMQSGLFHWDFACATLAKHIETPSSEFAAIFRKGISPLKKCYWNILGYISSAGKKAYSDLVEVALNPEYSLEERSLAIKQLALHSKQKFDRDLPSSNGHPQNWKKADLRLDEIQAWANNGYPDGEGYILPRRDPALEHPSTPLEVIVSRWDNKLAKKRSSKEIDPANPHHLLIVTDSQIMEKIQLEWQLPTLYLEFLKRFSPLKATIENRRFYNGGLDFISAKDIITSQKDYHEFYKELYGWHKDLVVIADHALDVFVMDLHQSTGVDAPIYVAYHDSKINKLKLESPSFLAFLDKVIK